MATVLGTPTADGLVEVLDALRAWQDDDGPFQLHPGDVGWFGRLGATATAAAVRTWRSDGRLVAVGLLDGPDVLRLALAPQAPGDAGLAARLVDDVRPGHGVLPAGEASVEVPPGALLDDLLRDDGWSAGERWTLLRRDLAAPVPRPALLVEVVGPDAAAAWTSVLRSAFDGSTAAVDRWHAMAGGPAAADARCLLGRDERGEAVAVVTVWSAGPGRPGLVEPMGVHPDHRGRGHGTAVTLAGAGVLRELGASSALVATPSANAGAVATYVAAGFRRLPERRDRHRDA